MTTITLAGVPMNKLLLQRRLPVLKYHSRMSETYMSDGGPDAPALRVNQPLGAHISYADFEFTANALTAGQIQTLGNAFLDQYTPQTLTISWSEEDSVSYSVLFGPDGFDYDIQDEDVDYDDHLMSTSAGIYTADFILRILSVVAEGS